MRAHLLAAAAACGLAIITCTKEPPPGPPPIPPECTGTVTATAVEVGTGLPLNGVAMQADDCGWRLTANGQVTLLRREGPSFRLLAVTVNDFNADQSGLHYWPGRKILVHELHGLTGNPVTTRFELQYQHLVGSVEGAVSGGTGGRIALYGVGAGTGLVAPQWANEDGTYRDRVAYKSALGPLGVVMHALEVRDDGGSPRYVAHGELAVTVEGWLSGGGPAPASPDANIALEPVAEATVAGEAIVELPNAGVTVRQWMAAPLGGLVLSELPPVTGAPVVPVDLPFPLISGLTPWVGVRAQSAAGQSWHDRAFQPPASGVAFDLPNAPSPASPGEAISAQTIFRWSGGPDGGHGALRLECSWSESIPRSQLSVSVRYIGMIESDGAEATLPLLVDGGVGIASNASCQWRVAWQPDGAHLGATAEDALEARGSESPNTSATFQ